MSLLSRLLKKNTDKNTLRNKIYEAFYSLGFKFTEYDHNNTEYLHKGYNLNADVFSVINQKANEVTRTPYFIKKVTDESQKKKYFQFKEMIKGVFTPDHLIRKSSIEKRAFDQEELPMFLDKPNRSQNWREFFAMFETYMDTTGNFYIYMRSPENGINAGVPIELYVLPAHLMQIVLKDNPNFLTDESPVSHYIMTDGNVYTEFKESEVLHIKRPNPNFNYDGSHLYGLSPLKSALINIQSSNSARTLNARTLANGGSFGFISSKTPMTEPQAQSLKDRLIEMDTSPERLSNIAGVSFEPVFTRISLTTDELKPFDYLNYDQKQICNVLGWDDILLNNDAGAKYDNYKQAIRRSYNNGVAPNLRLLEECFNRDLLPRYKNYKNTVFCFDESQLPEMQEDMVSLTKWLNDTLDRGVINRDEYRDAINYPMLETDEMKRHTVSMNIVALEDALDPMDAERPLTLEDE